MQPSKRNATPGWMLAATAISAMLGFFAVDSSHLITEALTPSLGQIIRFVPVAGSGGSSSAPVSGIVMASLLGGPTARRCVLSPRQMSLGGGSVVIDARMNGGTAYVVHWAGGATSPGSADCGRSAELMLSAKDLATLIRASSPKTSDNAIGAAAG